MIKFILNFMLLFCRLLLFYQIIFVFLYNTHSSSSSLITHQLSVTGSDKSFSIFYDCKMFHYYLVCKQQFYSFPIVTTSYLSIIFSSRCVITTTRFDGISSQTSHNTSHPNNSNNSGMSLPNYEIIFFNKKRL